MTPPDPSEIAKQARDHAWNWFALHAAQRMQTFNFFLVATAFLVAAYSTLLDKHRVGAFCVALLGSWLAIWFNRLDSRTRQLVKAGERALLPSEEWLVAVTGTSELRIVAAVDAPARGTSSYRVVINVVQWTIFGVFLLGAAYALWLTIDRPGVLFE